MCLCQGEEYMKGNYQLFGSKSPGWQMLSRNIIGLTLLSIISFAPSISFAQGSVQMLLEEITVVARKKSNAEALQDVPLAVSALSGDQIEATFVRDLQSLPLLKRHDREAPYRSPTYSSSGFVASCHAAYFLLLSDIYPGVLVSFPRLNGCHREHKP